MSINGNWLRVDSQTPCGVCGLKTESCHQSLTTGIWFCHTAHEHDAPSNFTFIGTCEQAGRYRMFVDEDRPFAASTTKRFEKAASGGKSGKKKHPNGSGTSNTFLRAVAKFRTQSKPRLLELARILGLPPAAETLHAMEALDVHYLPNDGYNLDCWVAPERMADGTICAWHRRGRDGTKRTHGIDPGLPGRGLFIPNTLTLSQGTHLLCPEGLSNTLAMTTLGVQCIGRPSDRAGGAELSQLVNLRTLSAKDTPIGSFPFVIVGDNDEKPDGKFPGRDGAIHIASQQAEIFGMPVWWYLDPDRIKDLREWFKIAFERYPSFEEMRECLFGMIDEYHEIVLDAPSKPDSPREEAHVVEPVRVIGTVSPAESVNTPVNRIAALIPTQTIAEIQAARCDMYCRHTNKVLMEDRECPDTYRRCDFPCKRPTCPGCRNYKLEQFVATINYHLVLSNRAPGQEAVLYLFCIQKGGDDPATAKQWANASERIRKLGGNYFRIDTDGTGRCLCCSTVEPLASQLDAGETIEHVTPREAAARLAAAVRAVPMDCERPFASSRRWKLIKDAEDPEWKRWKRIGSCYGSAENAESIVRARGATQVKWVEKQQRFFTWRAMEFKLKMRPEQKDKLFLELSEGETMYTQEEFEREAWCGDSDDPDSTWDPDQSASGTDLDLSNLH